MWGFQRMDQKFVKRKSERFAMSAPVQFVSTDAKHPLKAQIIDCSETGLCFETDSALPPGSIVFVSARDDNKFFRAMVRWCQRQVGAEKINFRIGAEYMDPVPANGLSFTPSSDAHLPPFKTSDP
jgi:hypothetical protein